MFQILVAKANVGLLAFSRLLSGRFGDLVAIAIPVSVYIITTFAYWSEPPSNDAMVVYRESAQFFSYGIKGLTEYGYPLHPPLLNLIVACFFFLFGKSALSFSIAGLTIYIVFLITSYFFLKRRFDHIIAKFFAVTFFSLPIVVINAVFPSNDWLLTGLCMLSIIGLIEKRTMLLAITLAVLAIAKETGLVIVVIAIAIELLRSVISVRAHNSTIRTSLWRLFFFLTPFAITFTGWMLIKHYYGFTEWRDIQWNQSNESSFLVVYKQLIQSGFFNAQLVNNTFNTFLLFFHWPILILLGVSLISGVYTARKPQKTTMLLFCLCFVYIATVFSFPTWTIARYGLPVLLICILYIAKTIGRAPRAAALICIALLLLNISNASESTDPFTINELGGTHAEFGVTFYNTQYGTAGADGIVYNQQFLEATKRSNSIIRAAYENNVDFVITNCIALKLGEKFWSISLNPEFYPYDPQVDRIGCINAWDLEKEARRMDRSTILVVADEYPDLLKRLGRYSDSITKVVFYAPYWREL